MAGNGRKPLDPEIVKKIRKVRTEGLTYRDLAKRFRVSEPTIKRVCVGKGAYQEEATQIN